MKPLFLFIILIGCSTERAEWDSGASARASFQEERQEQQVENVRNQQPSVGEPGTNQGQPF